MSAPSWNNVYQTTITEKRFGGCIKARDARMETRVIHDTTGKMDPVIENLLCRATGAYSASCSRSFYKGSEQYVFYFIDHINGHTVIVHVPVSNAMRIQLAKGDDLVDLLIHSVLVKRREQAEEESRLESAAVSMIGFSRAEMVADAKKVSWEKAEETAQQWDKLYEANVKFLRENPEALANQFR